MSGLSAPVSIQDAANACGYASGNLISIIKYGNIAIWKKYKPVVWANKDTRSALNGKVWNPDTALANQWWRATDGNFGLTYTGYPISLGSTETAAALNSMLASIDGGLNGWAYVRPSGGQSSPYRLLDFLQYDNSAPIPIRQFRCDSTVQVVQYQPWDIQAEFIDSSQGGRPLSDRDYILPTDITGVTLYPGIAIYKKVNGVYSVLAWCTGNCWTGNGLSSGTGGSISYSDEYTIATFGTDTFYVLPVFFTCELPQPAIGRSKNVITSGHRVIPVPYVDFDSFITTNTTTTQRIGKPSASSRRLYENGRKGTYNANITLDARGDFYTGGTAQTVKVALVNANWDGVWPPTGQPYYNTFSSVVVGADENHLVCTINETNLLLTAQWKVYIEVNGVAYYIRLIQSPPLE